MNWTREELVNWVRSRIDEMNPGGQSPETVGEGMIEKELDESATQILRTAQKQLVYPAGTTYRPEVLITKNALLEPHSIIIPLQSDFLRFLRVKADFWNKPVDSLVSTDDKYYRRQFNPDQKASKNIPVASIIPFQFTRLADPTIQHEVISYTMGTGVCTIGFSNIHNLIEGNYVNLSGFSGTGTVNGTFLVISKSYSTIIVAMPTGTVTGCTSSYVSLYSTVGAITYNQALEIFPAPDDFVTAMTRYQLATGVNAATATALGMTLVKNDSLTTGKKPIIYDCLIAEKMAAEELPDSLADPVVWLTAGRCLTSLRAADLAKAAYENYTASLSRLLIGFGGENPTPQQA